MLAPDVVSAIREQCQIIAKANPVLKKQIRLTVKDAYEDIALDLWKILGDYSQRRIVGNHRTQPKNLFSPMLSKGGSSVVGNKEVFTTFSPTGDILVTLKPSNFDYFWRESLYPAKYPNGATDIVGILTRGTKWKDGTVVFGHWANAGINISRSVGMPARPFVGAAVAHFLNKYRAYGVKVSKIPKTWA